MQSLLLFTELSSSKLPWNCLLLVFLPHVSLFFSPTYSCQDLLLVLCSSHTMHSLLASPRVSPSIQFLCLLSSRTKTLLTDETSTWLSQGTSNSMCLNRSHHLLIPLNKSVASPRLPSSVNSVTIFRARARNLELALIPLFPSQVMYS